jgi:cyclic pyranopterin phosphate synthase
MTNTAIVEPNHTRLRNIVELVADYGPRTMDFWSIWPRIDQDDSRAMFVRVKDVQPHLIEALEACEQRKILSVVKWFPRCLLGRFAGYHDDSQPTVLVEQTYWEQAPSFACIYEGVCSHAPTRCTGLTFPYIRKFGWEEDILQPARGLSPTTVNESTRNTQSQAPSAEAILAQLGLTADVQFAGFRVLSVRPHQRAIVISLLSPESDELKVRLYEPDPARRCYARTNHFDIVHEALPETLVGRTDAPLQALVAHLRTVNFDGRH